MNITERISTFLHHKDTSRKHPTKRTIGTKDLLTSFGFVGLELVAAGFLAACGGEMGATTYHKWKGQYCDRGADGKQAAINCQWLEGDGPTCPLKKGVLFSLYDYSLEPNSCIPAEYPLPQP